MGRHMRAASMSHRCPGVRLQGLAAGPQSTRILLVTRTRTTSALPGKRGLTENVYEELKERLFESQYGRGGWLPIDAIANELEVSRQPVMDAMKRLSIEGYVTIVPQVGCRVREYSVDEVQDFFLLLAEGEALMAELAAQRATAEDILRVQILSGQIGQLGAMSASKRDVARAYRTLNRGFHAEIRRIARSSPVTEIVESLADRGLFFIATSGRPMFAETLEAAHNEHVALVEAICNHNAKAARAAMKGHLLNTRSRLAAFLRENVQSPADADANETEEAVAASSAAASSSKGRGSAPRRASSRS